MSIFASRAIKVLALPFDEGQTVTIQKLAGRHLQAARDASAVESIEALKKYGGPAFQKEMADLGDPAETAALIARRQADPMNGYDRYTLLAKGIKAWSYPEPVNAEYLDDLDEEAADFLAREILKLTKPSLFDEADQKKADGPSPGA